MGQATIRSMTGFGRGTGQSPLGQFTAELRTVNNRYHDASVALPRELQPLEMRLRTLLKQRVPRGKVDCRVRWVPAQAQLPTVELNLPLAEAYHERLRQLAALTGEKQVPLQLLTTLPGVLEIGALDIDEEQLWGSLEPVLKSALQALDRERLHRLLLFLGGGLLALHGCAAGPARPAIGGAPGAQHGVGRPLRGTLEAVCRVRDADAPCDRRPVHGTGALLDDVGQLVGQGPLVRRRARRLPVAQDDLVADRVGVGVHRLGRGGGRTARMDADVREVGAERGFHPLPHRRLEWLPRPMADDALDGRLLLVLEGRGDAGVAGGPLEAQDGSRGEGLRPTGHRGAGGEVGRCGVGLLADRPVGLAGLEGLDLVRAHARVLP